MKLKSLLIASLAAVLTAPIYAADVAVSGKISSNTTWTSNNVYTLTGYVFVTSGATLTIEPGTVIKGAVSSGTGASALIIARGAKIMAEGTASNPIIFTSALDNLNGNLGITDTGLWGGVIVLGRASVNSRADGTIVASPVEDNIEGLSVTGTDADLIKFGGTDDADNSGVLKYISIRHGGAVIGTANEINGLTLGGVGSGTTIDYVEVFANKDDGIEFFGGTVNASHLVVAFGNDDGLDFDQGYRGNVQFVFGIQTDITSDVGDKAIEWDGATAPLTATPKGVVTVANATFIGVGTTGRANIAVNIRDSVEAKLYNSVFVNYDKVLDVENDTDDGPNPAPVLKSNLFFSHVAANNTALGLNARPAGTIDATAIIGDATNNIASSAGLRFISYAKDAKLDPRPTVGSLALTAGVQTLSGTGLVQANYRGAFAATHNWAAGWTKLWTDGYFDPLTAVNESSLGKPVNISTRVELAAGTVTIPGFVIGGTAPQTIMIRAVGPGLIGLDPSFTAATVCADPAFDLYAGATKIASADDWNLASGTVALTTRVGAQPPLATASKDAVLVIALPPGAYTAVVRGKTGGGHLLLEVYEVD